MLLYVGVNVSKQEGFGTIECEVLEKIGVMRRQAPGLRKNTCAAPESSSPSMVSSRASPAFEPVPLPSERGESPGSVVK